MNIVHLITSIEKGGAENHLSCLMFEGQVKKNKVIVIYLKKENLIGKNIFKYWA